MAFVDLPFDLWNEILTHAPCAVAARLLATNRGLREELLPHHQDRLQQAKDRAFVAAWVKRKARAFINSELTFIVELKKRWSLRPVCAALTSLLPPTFPRVIYKHQELAVMNFRTLIYWMELYVYKHGLITEGGFRVDATLAALTKLPEGSVQHYKIWTGVASPLDAMFLLDPGLTTEPAFDMTLEQELQAVFNYYYLEVIFQVLIRFTWTEGMAALQAVDPEYKHLASLDILTPSEY